VQLELREAYMKATKLLRGDHIHILRALTVLERMTAFAQSGETVNEQDALDIVAFLKEFGDRHHQAKEEAVLFPALLQDHDQRNYPQLCCMIFEHNQERSLTEGLEEAIRTKNTKEFVFCANRLIEKLREHIDKEDHVLFGLVESVLSPGEDERVATEIQKFEQDWERRVVPGLLQRLDEMESSYGRADPEPGLQSVSRSGFFRTGRLAPQSRFAKDPER